MQVYELISAGASPVSLATMKSFLKITNTVDDALIQVLIDAATEFGEKYTGREFRANQWKLLLDSFFDLSNSRHHDRHNSLEFKTLTLGRISSRIMLNRDPVDVVDSVQHLVDTDLVTVDSSIFYLKKNTQDSEILLFENQEWPDDTDNREQAIEILFTTKAYRCINSIIEAIQMHVANLYINRGDCPDAASGAKDSGAIAIYNQFRIARI